MRQSWRRRIRRAQAWAAPLVLAAGCYQPTLADGLPCSPSGNCPDGQRCDTDRICRATPAGGDDSGSDATGDVDAAPPIGAVRVTDSAALAAKPTLVWTGDRYAVLWIEQGSPDQLSWIAISAAGEPIGSVTPVTTDPEISDASMIWTRTDCGAVWQEQSNAMRMRRITAGGALAATTTVHAGGGVPSSPRIALEGTTVVVGWVQASGTLEIELRRVDANGELIDPSTLLGASDISCPAFASGPSLHVVWTDASELDLYYAVTGAAAGTGILTASPVSIDCAAITLAAADRPAIAWSEDTDGSGGRQTYVDTLAPGGRLSRNSLSTSRSSAPSIAWNGTEFGIAWVDERDGNQEIYFARADADHQRSGERRVTDDPASSNAPSLVWTGSEFAVAWVDARDGNREIYFAILP